ncbi:MAG: FtsK/SpoIIIE family DNA translocase, partial [Acidimicrobiales bacterium]
MTATRVKRAVRGAKRGATIGAVKGAVRGAKRGAATPRPRRPKAAPRDLRRSIEAAGVVLVVAGILDALGTYANLTGPVGRALRTAGGLAVGSGRVFLPILLVAVGVLVVRAAISEDEAHDRPRRETAGTLLAAVAGAGLLHIAHDAPSVGGSAKALEHAGGYVGAAIGAPLHAVLDTWGSAVLLVAIGGVALLVATGVPTAAVVRGIARAWRATVAVVRGAMKWLTTFGDDGGPGAPVGDGSTLVDGEQAGWFEPGEPSEPLRDLPVDPTPIPPLAAAGPTKQLEIDLGQAGGGGGWRLPPLNLLKRSKAAEVDRRPIEEAGRTLEDALAAHGVETRLIGITIGPTVARYELELGAGVKVARVTSLSKDIAYAMAAEDVRILAPIPGKSAIGVEVPNRQRQLVSLCDILVTEEARRATHPLEVALGRDINGRGVMVNLADMPHLLIAGATGAGKSSCINSIITSVLSRATPDQVRLILVDPKRVELGQYDGVPHLLTQVVTNPKRAANALAWVVTEMERRYDLLHEVGVRDITGYNSAFDRGELVADAPLLSDDTVREFHRLPFVLVVVDELNDLMMVAARDVEESICRIAQMARAVGIHLVIATQRPSVDVITGVIKANIPSRLAFKVSSQTDSRVILDQYGAEKLVGKGDLLLLAANSSLARRIQGCWVSEEETHKVVAHWRRQAQPVYVEGVGGDANDSGGGWASSGSAAADDDDDLLIEAMDLIVRSQLGSTSMLQRKLRVGFARAGRIMDLLERR